MRLVNTYNTEMGGKRPVYPSLEDAAEEMLEGIHYSAANSDGFPEMTWIDLDTNAVYVARIEITLLASDDDDDVSDALMQEITEEMADES